jgi:hypothetical protein
MSPEALQARDFVRPSLPTGPHGERNAPVGHPAVGFDEILGFADPSGRWTRVGAEKSENPKEIEEKDEKGPKEPRMRRPTPEELDWSIIGLAVALLIWAMWWMFLA